MYKFKVGDKVVPISKSVWGGDLSESSCWSEAVESGMNFLYVTGYNKQEGAYLCDSEQSDTGDFFLHSDLIPYVGDVTLRELILEMEKQEKMGYEIDLDVLVVDYLAHVLQCRKLK